MSENNKKFCDQLAEFINKNFIRNYMIIHEDEHGIMGKGKPIALLVSNKHVDFRDFEIARTKGLPIICENNSFGIKCWRVPSYKINDEETKNRLFHCGMRRYNHG